MVILYFLRVAGGMLRYLLLILAFFSSWAVASGTLVYVSDKVWRQLTEEDKKLIQANHIVSIVDSKSFGKILNAQGLNQSTQATQGGALLGEAIASAQYVDRSFQSSFDDYSAMGHLGAVLLGGLIGSTLDAPATSKYLFRYTVENGDGDVVIHDINSTEPFHLSPGLCVQIPTLQLKSNQKICSQTTESLLAEHKRSSEPVKLNQVEYKESEVADNKKEKGLIRCQLGNLVPILTTEIKCRSINGVILQ